MQTTKNNAKKLICMTTRKLLLLLFIIIEIIQINQQHSVAHTNLYFTAPSLWVSNNQ